MKALIVFLVGMTMGVGVMRATYIFTASQTRLMAFFLSGIVIGMVAATLCFWGWRGE